MSKPTFDPTPLSPSSRASPLPARRTLNSSTNSYESFADLTSTSTTLPISSPLKKDSRRSSFASYFFPQSTLTPPSSPTETTFEGRRTSFWRRYSLLSLAEGSELDKSELDEDEETEREGWLSSWQLIGLTIGLAGAQFCWTVEMAFGTPYLLSLGLPTSSTPLIWLAGPLSGLLTQPLIGSLSDASSSQYRRRQFIVLSAFLVLLSTLFIAFAREVGSFVVGGGLGDWDPDEKERGAGWARIVAVGGFYVLDFSLNGLQASLRALILDQAPASQQPLANAWHSRMTHFGNIFGYTLGTLNLAAFSWLNFLGGGQFRQLAVLSCVAMITSVSITCYTQTEKVVEGTSTHGIGGIISGIWKEAKQLDEGVKRVCAVQICAWSAWFPFLFYTTTWISELYTDSLPPHIPPPSQSYSTRLGSFALLIFAIVALFTALLLPYLSSIGHSHWIKPFSTAPTPSGNVLRKVLIFMNMRNFWTTGLGGFCGLMIMTFFIQSTTGGMIIVAGLGVSWAVNCWVPFALVMEAILELENSSKIQELPPTTPPISTKSSISQPFRTSIRRSSVSAHPVPASNPNLQSALTECTPLLPPTSIDESDSRKAPRGGTILGLHNLSIVLPQFLVALVAAAIFSYLGKEDPSAPSSTAYLTPSLFNTLSHLQSKGVEIFGRKGKGEEDVIWVLRFGGIAAGLGALMTRRLQESGNERRYREFIEGGIRDEETI